MYNKSYAQKLAKASKYALDWIVQVQNDSEMMEAINNSNTDYYSPDFVFPNEVERRYEKTKVMLVNSAVMYTLHKISGILEEGDRLCILNFADYLSAGGRYTDGYMAQEESLCEMSALWHILNDDRFRKVFDWRSKNYGYRQDSYHTEDRYHDDLFYTENCPFMLLRQKPVIKFDVISAAAVNHRRMVTPSLARFDVNREIMFPRMEKVFRVPAMYGTNILVLGAWGCGVFKNNPSIIARYWDELIEKYDGLYQLIIHPVPGGINLEAFKENIKYGV